MKHIITTALLAVTLLFVFFSLSSWGADLGNGAKVFQNHCAGCHQGGGNFLNKEKALTLEAQKKYEMDSLESIKEQVANGKAPMPGFKDRLDEKAIEDVSAYVLNQAKKGW